MEIELKYIFKDEGSIEKIFNDPYLNKIKDSDSEEEKEMRAVYFDTEDRRLYREGIAFRIRKEGCKLIATLKWNGSSEEGMHKREEINIPVDDESKLKETDIHVFDQSEMCQILAQLVGERKLFPMLEINFTRHQVRLDTGKSISELSVDQGEILCNGKRAPICELEIELYSGDEEDVISLGSLFSDKFGLIPENKSKLKRGFDLL